MIVAEPLGSSIVGNFISLFTKSFAPLMGLTFVTAKVAVKYFVSNSLKRHFDAWEIISWFGVDLCLLNLAVSISLKLNEVLSPHYGYEGVVCWYISLLVTLIISIFLYLYFNRSRADLIRADLMRSPFLTFKLFITLSLLWFISFYFFLTIIDLIIK